MIQAVVGAGGKTSYIQKWARHYREEGYRVFVTTSTHMEIEEDTVLSDDPSLIIETLQKNGYVMAGIQDQHKIKALSYETYLAVCQQADIVLIEADGSKNLPLKFPNQEEPVIYPNVDEIVIVCGLHSLGTLAIDSVHRLELAEKFYPLSADTVITARIIQSIVQKGYIEPLSKKYYDKKISIEPSCDTSLYQRSIASLMKNRLDVNLIKEEWFAPKPTLIICGGGHVSLELVRVASRLDFYVRVIDDRPEFANKERFALADEVICDSFEHLGQYMESDAYYIVVTRGHMADYQCVKTILHSAYRYVGMIGSKIKVRQTFERLKQEGVSETKIDSVHAPIGLPIKAVTPAEIAISIMAEIILEKHKSFHPSISDALLNSNSEGVLCVIIDKKGSTPRDVGSMMLVTDRDIIDSIGGGPIEYEAIQDAKGLTEAMIKEYYLNSETGGNLGMICGGSNKVLFLPIKGA